MVCYTGKAIIQKKIIVGNFKMSGIEEGVGRVRSLLLKYKNVILIFWIVLGVILFIIGVVLLTKGEKTEFVVDYTDCQKFSVDSDVSITCREYLEEFQDSPDQSCTCYKLIELKNLTGYVTLYYELPSFDQSSTNYTNSKDSNQLRGIFTEPPSPDCKPFQYDNGKAIVPCGAIADSMINDFLSDLQMITESTSVKVDLLRYGMLSSEDKAGYHNPENLTFALQNYTKPKHWTKYIYELDSNNEDNNGFQNEYFISWMRTDWKRKHIARVNHSSNSIFKDGLPEGRYQIEIDYRLLPPGYRGERKLIFIGDNTVANDSTTGRVLLSFGIIMLAMGILYPLYVKINSEIKRRAEEDRKRQNARHTANPPLLDGTNNASLPA